MNPIENLWNELDRRVCQKAVWSITELKKRLLEEWIKIGSNNTSKINYNKLQRLDSVIKNKGNPTKY